MKRIVSRSLALSLCLLLALPAVADAFLGSAKSEQLSGTYIRSDQQEMAIPTDFYEFSSGSYTLTTPRGSGESLLANEDARKAYLGMQDVFPTRTVPLSPSHTAPGHLD